jgi:hypothetical protein
MKLRDRLFNSFFFRNMLATWTSAATVVGLPSSPDSEQGGNIRYTRLISTNVSLRSISQRVGEPSQIAIIHLQGAFTNFRVNSASMLQQA